MPVDQFVEHLLPSLLSLASDPVPNVRVLLAKALRQTLLEKGVVLHFLGKIQHLGLSSGRAALVAQSVQGCKTESRTVI